MRHFSIPVLLSLSIASCAWVPSQEDAAKSDSEVPSSQANAAEETQEPFPRTSPVPELKISWPGREPIPLVRSLGVSQAGIYGNEQAITLPESIPERVQVELELPYIWDGSAQLKVSASAVTAATARPFELDLADLRLDQSFGGAGVRIQFFLTNLRAVLNDRQEQRILVTFTLDTSDPARAAEQVHFWLRSPAGAVGFSQTAVADWGIFTTLPRELESQARKLVLIRVISIQNQSPDAIRVKLPARLVGKATREINSYINSADKGSMFGSTPDCRYEPAVRRQEIDYGSDFFLLPGSPTLADSWTAVLRERPTDSQIVDIDPNGRTYVGIYAEGPKALDLAQKALDPGAAREVEVPISCRYECFYPAAPNSAYLNQCERFSDVQAEKKSACQARLAACVPFLQEFAANRTTHPQYGMPWSRSEKAQECGSARFRDLYVEGVLNRKDECNEPWHQIVVHTRRVLEGVKKEPVFINLSESSTRVHLSYVDDQNIGMGLIAREREWTRIKIQQTQ